MKSFKDLRRFLYVMVVISSFTGLFGVLNFYAPQKKLPVIDVVKRTRRGIWLFVYSEKDYQKLFMQMGILGEDNNLAEGVREFKKYPLNNVRIVKVIMRNYR